MQSKLRVWRGALALVTLGFGSMACGGDGDVEPDAAVQADARVDGSMVDGSVDAAVDGGVDARADASVDAPPDGVPIDAPPAVGEILGSWSREFDAPGNTRGLGFSPETVRAIGTKAYLVERGNGIRLVKWDGRVRTTIAPLVAYGAIIGTGTNELFVNHASGNTLGILDTTTDTYSSNIPLGAGAGEDGRAAAVRGSDGNIYLFGYLVVNGVTVNHAARWTGTNWQAVGSGNTGVTTDAVAIGSKIFVAGVNSVDQLPTPGHFAFFNVATSAWTPVALPSTITPQRLSVAGGEIVIAYTSSSGYGWGRYNVATGAFADNGAVDGIVISRNGINYAYSRGKVSRVDGTTEVPLCTALAQPSGSVPEVAEININALDVTSDDRIVAGTYHGDYLSGGTAVFQEFEYANGHCHALGNGLISSSWRTGGATAEVQAIAKDASGVYFGGLFEGGDGQLSSGAIRYNDTAGRYEPLGQGLAGRVRALAPTSTGLVAVGDFATDGNGASTVRVAAFNGTTWAPLGAGLDGAGWAVAVKPSGIVYVGGQFLTAGGTDASRIASWDGTTFHALGAGISGPAAVVYAIEPTADGIVAAGTFSTAGTTSVSNVAAWNETTQAWSALGTLPGTVRALATFNGQVCAGGDFTVPGDAHAKRLACWTGTAWAALGLGVDGNVTGLSPGTDGKLYVVGAFTHAGGSFVENIAAWDGSTWSGVMIPGPMAPARVLRSQNRIYFGGTSATGIARFDAQ